MSNKTIRIIFILAVAIAAISAYVQYQWIEKSIEVSGKDFDRRVRHSLHDVGMYLLKGKYDDYSGAMDLVEKITPEYYIVKVNDHISYGSLETLLTRELKNQELETTYEFGIYDCETNDMKMGKHVNMQDANDTLKPATNFPKQKKVNYYFGVNFPQRSKYLSSQLTNLKVSTGILFALLSLMAAIIFIVFRQRRLQEIQKDFVNNMTHEFKTPLSTIQIASEVLKKPNIVNNPDRLLNYATIIGNECAQLTNQVERVLQMAQTERGEIILKMTEFNLNDVCNEIVNKYRPLIKHKGGEITFNVDANLDNITADHLHIKNLVSNLMDNAIKYCDKSPIINLTTKNVSGGIELSVKDNGIGIKEEHQKHIFSKFYRVPTGDVHNVKGFGLGLSYVKLIAKRHGGQVKCVSEFGKGTEFVIFIPKNK
jgi:two-component system, OmpR family, phosphate regulon sensor histidine kinase PhoR